MLKQCGLLSGRESLLGRLLLMVCLNQERLHALLLKYFKFVSNRLRPFLSSGSIKTLQNFEISPASSGSSVFKFSSYRVSGLFPSIVGNAQ